LLVNPSKHLGIIRGNVPRLPILS